MIKKLKVMFIIPSLNIGGSERKVVDLTKFLNKEKFTPIVLCVTEGGKLKEELDKAGIKTYICRKKSKLDIFVVNRIKRILKQEKVDIVHTFVSTSKLWGRLAAIWARTKVIISTEESLFQPSKIAILLEKLFAKKTDIILTNSNQTLSSCQKYINFPLTKYKVIYNGINISRFINTNISKEEKRKELGLTSNDFVITCIARFDKRKGHKYLIEAFAKLNNINNNLKLLLVGDGKEAESIKVLVSNFNLSSKVIFAGFRQDINEILAISDIFVLPSSEEGFGNVIVEAMASKIITIGTNVGGIPEIIKDKYNGLIVDKENSESLYNSLLYCLEHPLDVKVMIDNAFKDIEKFAIDNIIQEYEDLYINLYKQKVKK